MDGAGGRVGISLANSDDSLQVTANPVSREQRQRDLTLGGRITSGWPTNLPEDNACNRMDACPGV
jgi:hypothetical protein